MFISFSLPKWKVQSIVEKYLSSYCFFLVLFFFNVAAVVSGTQEKGKLKKLDRFKKILKGCYFSVSVSSLF